jgi:hypothetical protein
LSSRALGVALGGFTRASYALEFSARTAWEFTYGYNNSTNPLFRFITMAESIIAKLLLACFAYALTQSSPLLSELMKKLIPQRSKHVSDRVYRLLPVQESGCGPASLSQRDDSFCQSRPRVGPSRSFAAGPQLSLWERSGHRAAPDPHWTTFIHLYGLTVLRSWGWSAR